MSDSLKMLLIALVAAAAVQLLLAPFVHKLYGFPVAPTGPQVAAPVGGQPVVTTAAPSPAPPTAALTAPNLEGMSVEAARDRFRDRGIVIIEDGMRPDAAAQPGTILQQRPSPGAALSSMEIRVIVAKPQAGMQVPDVLGKPLSEGRQILVDAGFEVPPPQVEASDKPKGSIIQQVPNPGAKAPPGAQIHIVVAEQSAVEVPKVQGKYLRKARSMIEEAGLAVGSIRHQEDPELGADQVIRQAPKAGEKVPPGTEIDLVVVAPN